MKVLEGITTEIERVSDRDNQPLFFFLSRNQKDDSKGYKMGIEKIDATLMVRIMQDRMWF